MDIFIAMYDKEYVSKYDVLYYCQYRDGKFVKVQNFPDADWGGYFHGNFTLKLKNEKLKKAYKYPEGDIIQCDFNGGFSSKCTFYSKPGSVKKAFTAKKVKLLKSVVTDILIINCT